MGRGQSRRVQPKRILLGCLAVVLIGLGAKAAGWDIGAWFQRLGHATTTIPPGYLVAAIVLITVQITATAFAWYSILRASYGSADVIWIQVLACYATSVALNNTLPGSIGTLVMVMMFTTIIPAASLAGVVGGFAAQKIFYVAISFFSWIYLFGTVAGTFSRRFGFVRSPSWVTIVLAVGAVGLLVLVGRLLRPRLLKWWRDAKAGAVILTQPRRFVNRVVVPELISWLALLGATAVLLAAYSIPVSFHAVISVLAGDSVASSTALTPGGAGVVQGFNNVSLSGLTSPSTATAYSVAQQLVSTVWSIILAIVLMIRAFGWSGGKVLVERSYSEAREQREQRATSHHRRSAPAASPHDSGGDQRE
jgi:uncharacterized membrane protein YbhN (UPF0104 family)